MVSCVVRRGIAPNFDMAFDGDFLCFGKINIDDFILFIFGSCKEYPVTKFRAAEVFALHPTFSLIWMSPNRPAPYRLEDFMIYIAEGFLGTDMPIVV